jgi:DNA-binding LacI/PurR family transcriptional regulator
MAKIRGGAFVTKLPFKIRRDDGMSLTDQFAAGLGFAIRSGYLHAGDSLPTLLEMAKQTGVSEIVVRHAVKRLSKDGLVRARPHNGITVSDVKGHTWRALVLGLHWAPPSMYYQSVLSGVVTERLHAANVLFNATHITMEEASKGFPKVSADLSQAVSLVVMQGSADGVDAVFSNRGIPFIHVTTESRPSPLAARAILKRNAIVLPVVCDHCLACGVHEVLLVGLPGEQQNIELRKLLVDARIRCRTLSVQQIAGLENPECVERGALNAMDVWLKRERRLPDLIWFSDDFLARGAILAMTNCGVRIPKDAQVITWANRGLGPVFMKPLTRVEMDPIRDGEAVAACVLEQLDSKCSDKKPIELAPVFIEGATTIKKA